MDLRIAIGPGRPAATPLGHWSQERVFALGCGVTLVLALLLIGALWLRSRLDQPRLPAEAPAVYEVELLPLP